MLKNLRMIGITAGYNFRLWKGNTRILAVFLLSFILNFLLSDKYVSAAVEMGTSIQLAEAFIWTFGDSNSILLSSLLLLLLYGDMPFITPATPFFLVRGNRKIWILGQMLYVLLSSFLYLVFVLLSTCFLCMRYAYMANIWSFTTATLAYSEKGKELTLPASAKVLEMSRPYETMMWIFVLMLLYVLVMAAVLLFFNLWKGQAAGIISVLIFSAYGMLLNPENIQKILKLPEVFYYKIKVWLGWLSPLNHATYQMHSFGYDNLPTFGQTGLVFGGILILLVTASVHVIRKYSFHFRGTEN